MKDHIIKEEKIGYLKTKVMLMQGTLQLWDNRLKLEAHKTGISGFGILGSILKRKVESKIVGFDISLSEITSITQGKHGANKNVLVIEINKQEEYKVLVKDYYEWAQLLGFETVL